MSGACPPSAPSSGRCRRQEFDEGLEGGRDLAKQRQNLKKRLGLGGPMDALVDTAGGWVRGHTVVRVGGAGRGRAGRG